MIDLVALQPRRRRAAPTFDHGFFGRAFHSVFDYDQVARARESDEWHNDLRHQEVDNIGAGVFAQFRYRTGFFEPADLIQSSCLLFNSTNTVSGIGIVTGLPSDDPAFRASALVHEGWHAWKENHDIQNPPENGGHAMSGPIRGTACNAGACDFMYFHAVSNYQPGELWIEKDGRAQSHSVFQTQMEFLCDLADQSSQSVPFVTRQVAAQTANWISLNNFRNGPAFLCGSPDLVGVPAGSPPAPPPGCTSPCTTVADCRRELGLGGCVAPTAAKATPADGRVE